MSTKNVLATNDHLLFLKDAKAVLTPLQEIPCPPALDEARAAFVQNLSGAMEVGHIPFFLVRASVWRQRLNQIIGPFAICVGWRAEGGLTRLYMLCPR